VRSRDVGSTEAAAETHENREERGCQGSRYTDAPLLVQKPTAEAVACEDAPECRLIVQVDVIEC
jgi:hypothetical protein